MKKFSEMLKPFYSIILGALMLLFYMDWLEYGGAGLALGIVAMVLAVYYIGIGIMTVVMGDKLTASTRSTLESLSIMLFPIFMFVFFLLETINGKFGPTDWVIHIMGMASALGFVLLYAICIFGKNAALKNITRLFGLIFILALLLFVLFAANGLLGNIDLVQFAIFFVFTAMLLPAVKPAEEAPKSEE